MRWKRTAYAVLASSTLLAMSGWSAPVFAESTAVGGTTVQHGESQVQVTPEAPADQLQRAQILNILNSDVIPALSHYGLGDFLKSLKVQEAYYTPDSGMFQGIPLWNVMLASPVDDKGLPISPQAHFVAYFNAKSGELLGFDLQNPDWTCTQGASPDLAKSQAEKFLQAFEPALYQKTQISDEGQGQGVTSTEQNGKQVSFYASVVNFYEKVNGVPFKSNLVSVNIDQYGHVVGMRKQFPLDTSQLPPVTSAMTLDQANQVFANDLQMHKFYVTGQQTRNADGTLTWSAKPMLIYLPEYPSTFDAVTGKTESDYPLIAESNLADLQVNGTGDDWNINKLDTVEQKISDLTQTDLSKLTYQDEVHDAGLNNANVKTVSWGVTNGKYGFDQQIIASYDKSSGQIFSLTHMLPINSSNAGESAQPKMTLQQGEAVAEKLLPSLLPSGQQEVMLTRELDISALNAPPSWYDPSKSNVMLGSQQNAYDYTFNFVHQGVPILDQAVTIELDPLTGALRSFNRTLPHQVTLPDNVNSLSADQIKQAFMKDHPLELFYSWPQYAMEYAPSGLLVYGINPNSIDQPYTYDAFTGQPVALTK